MPFKVQATADKPPTAIELKGAFDGVCSPAALEDFPEDWPAQNARPAWYWLDFIDLIVRSRSIADQAYAAILFEVERLVDTLDTMDRQDAAAPEPLVSASKAGYPTICCVTIDPPLRPTPSLGDATRPAPV